MFCRNCGKELEAETRFCSNCGTAIEEQKEDNFKKTKFVKINKKLLAYVLTGLICVAVVIIVILTFVGNKENSTPEAVAESFVAAYFTADAEKLVDCVPEFMLRQMAVSNGLSVGDKEAIINVMESNISDSDRSDCVVLGAVRDGDSSILSEYIDNMDNYGATYEELSKIEEYCIVCVNASVDNENRENVVFCVKFDGSWYAVDID